MDHVKAPEHLKFTDTMVDLCFDTRVGVGDIRRGVLVIVRTYSARVSGHAHA
jgi:hypothetical protein